MNSFSEISVISVISGMFSSYAAAGGANDRKADCRMNFFITLAHITFLRKALSFTTRPWANIPSSVFILSTRRIAASDWLTP